MSSLSKLKNNIDKLEIETIYRKKPKKRCPICKRYSLFFKNKELKTECLRCHNSIG